jgi:hypothetical protein
MAEEYGEEYVAYQSNRGGVRGWVRGHYLRSALRLLHGRVLDIGCGLGSLLERAPKGSLGLEYNPSAVSHCVARGLDVEHYDGSADEWALSVIPQTRAFESVLISHVLEHLDEPMFVLNRILQWSGARGVERVVVIVPGAIGYRDDPTHRTFVQEPMLSAPSTYEGTCFRPTVRRYFPVNLRAVGNVFRHHELQVVFERVP